MSAPVLSVGLNAVILAVTDEVPRILCVEGDALPFGHLDPLGDHTLELGLRAWVREQTGLELGYVEQLYTFGDLDREMPVDAAEGRRISVAYLALVREAELEAKGRAVWRSVYEFLPWEDWREGQPRSLERQLVPALLKWSQDAEHRSERESRRERVEIALGLESLRWDEERVLERYELLWEAGLVRESGAEPGGIGVAMRLDHRRMLATGLGRLRGKLKYRPVVFELMPPTFTLFQLQRVVEALAGCVSTKGTSAGWWTRAVWLRGPDSSASRRAGRPAELFRFRREVIRERPAPGVGLPTQRGLSSHRSQG